MKILITGATGQLGCELLQQIPNGYQVTGLSSKKLDITNQEMVQHAVTKFAPDIIVNTAAYTAVDLAETKQKQAFAVNSQGVENLAVAAVNNNAKLIHISTDFIFDGTQSHPYRPEAKPAPMNIYGKSKLQGEQRIITTNGLVYVIVRTSWLYSIYGNNFVRTILRLLKELPELAIVTDQVSSPTWANGLAKAVWQITGMDTTPKIMHYSDAGIASWYDFAVAIQEEAFNLGMLAHTTHIRGIPSSAYPLPANRPHFSVLDTTNTWNILGSYGVHWRQSLQKMLIKLKESEGE